MVNWRFKVCIGRIKEPITNFRKFNIDIRFILTYKGVV